MKGKRKSNFPNRTGVDSMKLRTRDSVVSLKKPEDEPLTKSHVFTLTASEIERKVFQLRYHTCDDAYYRLGSTTAAIQGWDNGVYAAVNMERHVQDKMVYMTRKSGHREASISWKVDLIDTGLVVDSIQALTLSRTQNGGIVTYDIVSPDARPDIEQLGYVSNGWQSIYLIAYLSGDAADDCHEQTQLLYQDYLSDHNTFPLDILITLKPLVENLCTCDGHSKQLPHVGIPQDIPQVHTATIEKCTCYFPEESPSSCEGTSRQGTPYHPATCSNENVETGTKPLSILDKHEISLPGTPIHRKHYGRSVSAGSYRSHKLIKNKVQSKAIAPTWQRASYDNSGMESPMEGHAGGSGTTSQSESELRVLESGSLEDTGRRDTATSKLAWSDRRREVQCTSTVVDEEETHRRRFCKGHMCTVS